MTVLFSISLNHFENMTKFKRKNIKITIVNLVQFQKKLYILFYPITVSWKFDKELSKIKKCLNLYPRTLKKVVYIFKLYTPSKYFFNSKCQYFSTAGLSFIVVDINRVFLIINFDNLTNKKRRLLFNIKTK